MKREGDDRQQLLGAATFYAEIAGAIALRPDVEALYKRLNRLFQRLLNERTQFAQARLVGAFAKLDYLLKEGRAEVSVVREANDLRVHLSHAVHDKLTADEMRQYWQRDARYLAGLIAFVYQEPIPKDLLHLLPPCPAYASVQSPPLGDEPSRNRSVMAGSLRMIVERWDDRFVYGTLSEDGVEVVKVNYVDNKGYPFDWSYLKALWHRGSQINLIRPYRRDGVLFPELIILEPDYLVDISQIAHCFAVYAESPLVSLMDRLAGSESNEAMLMGFLASQLLDEELHNEQRPYAEVAMDFFRNNALDLLTLDLSADFHVRAQQQRMNIHNAVDVQLPLLAERYRKEDVVVEPSFVSEMLGLQGRMDFLQTDMRVLIEQKSGKAAFVPYDPTPQNPQPREEHYVQMLLYMAILRYNHRQTYEQNKRELHAFLMYSAYPNALVGLSFSPQLLFRAFRLRNRLATTDMYLARDGFGFLKHLTADSLNEKGIQGRLWENYVKPRLEQTLLPIQKASQLEWLYCQRLLRFVAAEHQLSKLGNQTKENSGFASAWHDSLDEKRMAGNIYDELRLCRMPPTGHVSQVHLLFPKQQNSDTSNFRLGDAVVLYAYAPATQPDIRRGVLFRGTLSDVSVDGLTISLRNRQTDAKVFGRNQKQLWAVEHDFIESTTTQLYRGIHAFLSAPQERRDFLLMQRQPRIDTTSTLKGDYGLFNELSLHVKQARDLFLIIGPPGTGKTSFGMYNTLREELLEPHTNVLVMAYTNRAVDEISSKLHGEIDFIRIGSEHSCAQPYQSHLLCNRVLGCKNRMELQDMLMRTRVFVGTTTTLSAARSLFQLKRFSLAIVDEASQILEPSLLALMSMRHKEESAIRKFVMIGDHKQLPAVVQQRQAESEVSEPQLRGIGLTDCRLSMFERFLHRYGTDPTVCYMLTRQGRMHPDIADFPNRAFYGGRLDIVPLPHQRAKCTEPRVRFLDVMPYADDLASDKANQAEADVIARLVSDIYTKEHEKFDISRTVGIIVPYRNQIATIRNTIDRLGIPLLRGITIDTVERYQGSQRRYIIYGFTIRYAYQLRFLTDTTFVEDGVIIDRKLNVAMTRAQEQLILIGNARLLQNDALFARLINEINKEQT